MGLLQQQHSCVLENKYKDCDSMFSTGNNIDNLPSNFGGDNTLELIFWLQLWFLNRPIYTCLKRLGKFLHGKTSFSGFSRIVSTNCKSCSPYWWDLGGVRTPNTSLMRPNCNFTPDYRNYSTVWISLKVISNAAYLNNLWQFNSG